MRLIWTFKKIFPSLQNSFSGRLSSYISEPYLVHSASSYNCTDGCCCYIVPKDNRSFIAAVNSCACTVGNIARGNNQFVVTLENFISTRRQKAGARKVAPLNILL